METEPQISFIIVNFRSKKYLSSCINSIRNNCSNFEIIIVNNDNDFFDYPDAQIINSENKGFGSACNLGAKTARGKILCFLNPDTEVLNNPKKIIEYFNAEEKTGIIGAKIVDTDNKTEKWCAGCETTFWNLIRNNIGLPKSKKIWNSSKTIECGKVSGCSLFIKKDIFDSIGGFDEKFFMYFEDEDLCKRIRQKGFRVIYFPEFSVKHLGGKSFSSKFKQKKYFYKSMFYYFKKHFLI